MSDIGPDTPLICVTKMTGSSIREQDQVYPGSIYFVAKVVQHSRGHVCPHDHCGATGYTLKDKGPRLMYCPNIFRPLNDGNESLLSEEDKEDQSGLGKYIKVAPIIRKKRKEHEQA